jgi:hypothetical protein
VAASPAPVVLTTPLGPVAGAYSTVELHADRTEESAAPAAARRSAPALIAYAPRAPADTTATAHPSSTQLAGAFLDQIVVWLSGDTERRR